jgi:hypothetical protein
VSVPAAALVLGVVECAAAAEYFGMHDRDGRVQRRQRLVADPDCASDERKPNLGVRERSAVLSEL